MQCAADLALHGGPAETEFRNGCTLDHVLSAPQQPLPFKHAKSRARHRSRVTSFWVIAESATQRVSGLGRPYVPQVPVPSPNNVSSSSLSTKCSVHQRLLILCAAALDRLIGVSARGGTLHVSYLCRKKAYLPVCGMSSTAQDVQAQRRTAAQWPGADTAIKKIARERNCGQSSIASALKEVLEASSYLSWFSSLCACLPTSLWPRGTLLAA